MSESASIKHAKNKALERARHFKRIALTVIVFGVNCLDGKTLTQEIGLIVFIRIDGCSTIESRSRKLESFT